MKIYNIDKLDKNIDCLISFDNNIDINDEKIKYLIRYVCTIYDVNSIKVYSEYIQFRITESYYKSICYNNVEIVDNYLYIVESIDDGIVLDRSLKIRKLNESLQNR
mgnify:CR=1 FL=1